MLSVTRSNRIVIMKEVWVPAKSGLPRFPALLLAKRGIQVSCSPLSSCHLGHGERMTPYKCYIVIPRAKRCHSYALLYHGSIILGEFTAYGLEPTERICNHNRILLQTNPMVGLSHFPVIPLVHPTEPWEDTTILEILDRQVTKQGSFHSSQPVVHSL
uniref:Uncharacterized protein n=1 Tax=Compsopogon caeruleus TaxID=31354 RepID=A0A7S1TA34_9RHOD